MARFLPRHHYTLVSASAPLAMWRPLRLRPQPSQAFQASRIPIVKYGGSSCADHHG
jgi:hypothetical protein